VKQVPLVPVFYKHPSRNVSQNLFVDSPLWYGYSFRFQTKPSSQTFSWKSWSIACRKQNRYRWNQTQYINTYQYHLELQNSSCILHHPDHGTICGNFTSSRSHSPFSIKNWVLLSYLKLQPVPSCPTNRKVETCRVTAHFGDRYGRYPDIHRCDLFVQQCHHIEGALDPWHTSSAPEGRAIFIMTHGKHLDYKHMWTGSC